jgi:3',5'-cyclic AMP phosphodiesterase CpdA
LRILQASDLHFGRHAIARYLAAIARRIEAGRYDVVAFVGDLTQRNFRRQLRSAHLFVEAARRYAQVITIPGNHDVAWWWKPAGLGLRAPMYRGYRKWISRDLEPVLQVPGVTFVGINSCHGVQPYTLTARPRDVSVVGAVRPAQWERARARFAAAPAGDLKVLMFHHNLLRGDLSNRWGLVNREAGIGEALATGADLVLNGHDHQTRIEAVERDGRRMVVSHSTSLCERTRGGLAQAFQEIEVSPAEIRIRACVWSNEANDFTPREDRCFSR